LQEKAKQQQQQQEGDGGVGSAHDMMGGMDMDHLRSMFGDSLSNPETQKYLEQMGQQFGAAMEQLSKMSPEELEKQMQEAMKLMSDSSIVDSVVQNKEEILKTLESSGTVPPEELARFKTDPEYFELKMRESFDQMQDIFGNPDAIKTMTETMKGMGELFDSQGELLGDISKLLDHGDLTDDTKIEEARLKLLSGDFSDNPVLKQMIGNDEMQDLLKDPKKWRDNVKEGTKGLFGKSAGKDEL